MVHFTIASTHILSNTRLSPYYSYLYRKSEPIFKISRSFSKPKICPGVRYTTWMSSGSFREFKNWGTESHKFTFNIALNTLSKEWHKVPPSCNWWYSNDVNLFLKTVFGINEHTFDEVSSYKQHHSKTVTTVLLRNGCPCSWFHFLGITIEQNIFI